MGIIINQTIKGSFWSYLGVAIGFVTTSYLFTRYLTPSLVGLFGLLVSYSTLFAQFFSLGFIGVTSRMFPYFRNKENNHNGFILLAIKVLTFGFIFFLLLFYFFSPFLVESNQEKSKLFADYFNLLIPLTFFTMYFVFLDTYSKVLFNAVIGTVLVEFFQRVLILLVTVSYIFGVINQNQLIFAYVLALCIKTLIITFYLFKKGELKITKNLEPRDFRFRKEMINVGAYSILGGFGSLLAFSVDKILINQILGIADTGVYTIAFFFGAVVAMPSRSLLKISSTIIAEAWKKEDVAEIKNIYFKSCLNQYIIGGIIFLGIWINIDNLLTIIGDDYVNGKWVIFFISIAFLFDMLTGVNGYIITLSKLYKWDAYFVAIMIALVIVTNLIFIPIWGITGAAMAIALSFLINNIMRFLLLLIKYKMQPFNYRFIIITFILVICYALNLAIPKMNLIPDLVIRSGIIAIVFGFFIYKFKISADINGLITKFINIKR